MKVKREVVKVQPDNFADSWQPEKLHEKFTGVIVDQHLGETKFGTKPFIVVASVDTGETVSVISASAQLRGLNKYPLQTYVELEFLGKEVALIAGKRKKINRYAAYVDKRAKAGDDWTGGKYYGSQDQKNSGQKRGKPAKRGKRK